jgi:hypothetical protein
LDLSDSGYSFVLTVSFAILVATSYRCVEAGDDNSDNEIGDDITTS